MSKIKDAGESVKVLFIFKDEGDHGGFASAYGIHEIEINKDLLLKNGKIIYKSEPDIFEIFRNNLSKKAREIFGI
jgi:hypothetical protein